MSSSSIPWAMRCRGSALYYLIQAAGIALWWLAMALYPAWRTYFVTTRYQERALLDFAYPDALLIAGSLLAAWAVWRHARSPWTQRLLWALAGAFAYPAVYVTASCVLAGGQGWAAALFMGPGAAGCILAAWTVRPDGGLFREAKPASRARHLLHTFGHTLVFWATTLALGPFLLAQAERAIGLEPFVTPAQDLLPWLLFVPVGLLNLHTGYTMASYGKGTPLPMQTASELVVRGPYRVMRNPMATTGLALGALVGWAWGSWLTLAVTLAGGLVWNTFVRPLEERDLLERFGEPYAHYRDAVPCWIPTLTPYVPANTA